MYYTDEIIDEIISDIAKETSIKGDLHLSDKCTILHYGENPMITNSEVHGSVNLAVVLHSYMNNEEDIDQRFLTLKEIKELYKETIRCIKRWYEAPNKYFS